ncbi:MAG: NUDIX domain-containing protein [Anaerolineae bacterium]
MSFMRLGTRIAVINERAEILLSKRGDFGIWALPGGRVDSGEWLHQSAIREVREETGLEVAIERPIGLYFQQGRARINVLYRARVSGGRLSSATDETLDNRFFAPSNLPDALYGHFYIDGAYSTDTHLHTITSSRWELLQLDLKLRWRWLQNWFAGKPEPAFTPFTVRALGLIFTQDHDKIYARDGLLPQITSTGKMHLHHQLSRHIGRKLDWQWAGIWQDPQTDTLEFILTATTTDDPAMQAVSTLRSLHQRQITERIQHEPNTVHVIA